MVDVFMREVECSMCGARTRHRITVLEEIIQHQSAPSDGGCYINYACPECSTLTRSLVIPGAKVFRGMDLSKFPEDLTVSFVSLECVGQGCESPVILLAAVKHEQGTDASTVGALSRWHNHNARCANDHAPHEPFDFRSSLRPPKLGLAR
jgi:hypothetical protein